jgi:yeast amino acid transporter
MAHLEEKPTYQVDTKHSGDDSPSSDSDIGFVADNVDGLHRKLSNRQIQWIAVGGSIGTALFVSIGWGLIEGGPGSLFLGYFFYACVIGLINNSMAEMAVYMPISG